METKKLDKLTKDKKNILLYLETCLVDHRGFIQSVRMNGTDWKIMKEWKEKGVIDFGRRSFKDITNRPVGTVANTHWVKFSDQAWQLVHKCRRERAERHTDSLGGTKEQNELQESNRARGCT